MAIQIQLRQGTTTEHNTFTGAVGEVTYDTEKKQLRVHDGTTVGGKVVDDPTRNVTSQVSASTETVAGKAKIATTAIAQEGVNDTDFITAKKLRDALNATGTAPISACRGFGKFNGITGAIVAGVNISSITRISSGLYEVALINALSNVNYTVVGVIEVAYGVEGTAFNIVKGSQTTTSFRIHLKDTGGGGDRDFIHFSIFGG